MTGVPMQDSNFIMCGAFCIYIAHLLFNSNFNGDASDFIHINEPILKRFLTLSYSVLET